MDMENQTAFGGTHLPSDEPAKKPEMPGQPIPAVGQNVPLGQPVVDVAALQDGIVKVMAGLIGEQKAAIEALSGTVIALTEKVSALEAKQAAAEADRAAFAKVIEDLRFSLTQYIRTNELPHDVLKVLQKENEAMIRKLEIRPQSDILRSVRDLMATMDRQREISAKKGETACLKLLDLLRITAQEDILEDHGVQVLCDEVGARFKPQWMAQVETVPTADQQMHMRVARCCDVGFQFEKEVLMKEKVAVYIYDPDLQVPAEEAAPETVEEAGAAPEAPAAQVPAEEAVPETVEEAGAAAEAPAAQAEDQAPATAEETTEF